VALLGNGMGSTGDQAQLIQVNIATGDITPISTKTGSASTPNGLSTPTPLLVDGKLVAVYAGDALGNLWRFPVSSTDGIGAPIKLFTTKNNLLTGKNEQPISAAPTVSDKLPLGGKTGGYYIYFGTGKTLDRTDITYGLDHKSKTDEEQAIQALYAVFDVANDKGIPGASGLTPDKLVQQTMDQDKVSNYPVDLGSKSGWFLNLQAGDPDKLLAAERILSPVVYNASSKAVTVVTAFPKENGCYNVSLAGSHFININAATGGQTSTSRIRGAAAGVSQVLVTGSVGGITTGNGVEKGSVNNYTSNGVGGGIGEKTTDGIVLNLRRTSWSQLF
jgi:type IV pilus assembly protein PilY1